MFLWQLFQIVLAFIDEFYGYDVMLWPHRGRSSYAKLTGFWLVCLCSLVGHMINVLFWLTLIGQIWSYDQNNLPCSFQLNCHHQVVLFVKKKKKQEYSLLKLFENVFWGSKCIVLMKMAMQGGELGSEWVLLLPPYNNVEMRTQSYMWWR